MERVQRLKDGRVRAEVNAPDGRWSIILAPFEGTYVLAERERILNSERTYITYSNVTSFSSARIPMAVTYAHGPVNASPDSIERATFRFQVTSVEDPADTSWFSTFQAPEQWTAPDGEVVPISYEIEMEHGTTVARKLDSGISASTEN